MPTSLRPGARYRVLKPLSLLLLVLVLAAVAYTANPGESEEGIASWYGYPYDGRRAAGGEIYDMETLTAAHRTLPFGTWVRVLNLSNEKTVDVRITDRGPFVDGRIIDLSRAAARAINLITPGIVPVRLEVIAPGIAHAVAAAISPPAMVSGLLFAVQVGAFQDRSNAERWLAHMRSEYGEARLVQQKADRIWRVLVGFGKSLEEARTLSQRFRQESGVAGAFVVRLGPAWVGFDGAPVSGSKRDSSAE